MTHASADSLQSAAAAAEAVNADAAAASGAVVLKNVCKRYGDTVALDGLSLLAFPGEILGIAGPNGSGKSTMAKILAGEVVADSGEVKFGASELAKNSEGAGGAEEAADAARRVAIVHQEPQLFPNMTVAENLIVGRERSLVMIRRIDEIESDLLVEMGLEQSANTTLSDLPLAAQQRTEIARSLAQNARVFLFDEPNSALTDEESEDLFRRMHSLADAGRVVILVSHRLHELVEHANRVAMLIDGRCKAIFSGEDLTEDRLARELVVGAAQSIGPGEDVRGEESERAVLEVDGWTHREGRFSDVSMKIGEGEILALTGMEGSGARELAQSLAGYAAAEGGIEMLESSGDTDGGGGAGVVRSAGEEVADVEDMAEEEGRPPMWKVGLRAIRDAAADALAKRDDSRARLGREGVAFVGADRAHNLFQNLSVGENLVARLTGELGRSGILPPKAMKERAGQLAKDFMVKAGSVDDNIMALSGGNQQKVVIAAAMATRPRVLILEEPTRGVDVPSKREIYRLLRQFVSTGEGALLYCTEDSEIFEVADRTLVVAKGRIAGELNIGDYEDIEACATARARLEAA